MSTRSTRKLGVLRLDVAAADDLARSSAGWGDPGLVGVDGREALLVVGIPAEELMVLGAFQRVTELDVSLAGWGGPSRGVRRRGSGGAAAALGPGTVWVELALTRPDVMVPCTADKLVNRYVRPLLRGLTRASGVVASYFGRDWVSAGKRPIALVGFGHEARTGRCLFEAIVGVRAPCTPEVRSSFLGKSSATLEEVAARSIAPGAVASAIVDAYQEAFVQGGAVVEAASALPLTASTGDVRDEPAWAATREEAIGRVAAGRDAQGMLRVGGELMASRDALARLEAAIAGLSADAGGDAVGAIVDDALATRGAVTFGVRSLASIRDVIVEARR